MECERKVKRREGTRERRPRRPWGGPSGRQGERKASVIVVELETRLLEERE